MISYPLCVATMDTRVIEAGRPDSPPIILVHDTGGRAVLCDFLAGSLDRHQAPGVEYH